MQLWPKMGVIKVEGVNVRVRSSHTCLAQADLILPVPPSCLVAQVHDDAQMVVMDEQHDEPPGTRLFAWSS